MYPRQTSGMVRRILLEGGVGVLPTDTIYGIVGSALNEKTVARIYKLRRRNPLKPMIILIGSLSDLRLFDISLSPAEKKILKKIWPNKVSVILKMSDTRHATSDKFKYLHRGINTLAFRLPKPYWLKRLLAITGPLVAPSANWEGKPPATTIREAKKYFGKKIDFYIDAGRLVSPPSTLVEIKKGKLIVLRGGAVKL